MKRIKASTLVETLIALVIILFISALGLSLYLKITLSTASEQKVSAGLLISAYADSTRKYHLLVPDSMEAGGVKVVRKVEDATGLEGSKSQMVTFSAFSSSGSLLKRAKFIMNP